MANNNGFNEQPCCTYSYNLVRLPINTTCDTIPSANMKVRLDTLAPKPHMSHILSNKIPTYIKISLLII